MQSLYGAIAPTTITASESWLGSMQFNSNDFDNSQALEVPIQPMSVGLGALNSALNIKGSYYKNVSMGMKPTCTISTVFKIIRSSNGYRIVYRRRRIYQNLGMTTKSLFFIGG